jgi:hypothetical protein
VLVLALVGCASNLQPPKESLRARKEKALGMFAERCKKAGEFIHRTVDNVNGVYILRRRPPGINYGNQFALDDPYGRDLLGDGYFIGLLRGSYQSGFTSRANAPRFPLGYQFVDVVDLVDGVRYRYTGWIDDDERVAKDGTKFTWTQFLTKKVVAPEPPPRYGVTYDDISTYEEREYWIAGGSLKVVDLMTSEVIAERIGYMVDVQQGNKDGGRSPWLFAADHACPAFPSPPTRPGAGAAGQGRQTQRFLEKVLKPTEPSQPAGTSSNK